MPRFDKSPADQRARIERLVSGKPLRTIELCSGCGGLSLGMQSAGFELAAHVESDESAAASYALNFKPSTNQHLSEWSQPRDMVKCFPELLGVELGLGTNAETSFDVLAAGLPCQAFARIGRSKLRSVAGLEDAFTADPRAALYFRFLDYIQMIRPIAIILENVPDIMNFAGKNVPEEISVALDEMGYRTRYTLLNAAFYGVPQYRERLFLIAIDATLGVDPVFPTATHWSDLPIGYQGSRNVATKFVGESGSHFVPIVRPSQKLAKSISVEQALADLPMIFEHFKNSDLMRQRRVQEFLDYRDDIKPSPYATTMRSWPNFETGHDSSGHVVRLTPRDFPIFKTMPPGADYPAAVKIAEQRLQRKVNALIKKSGSKIGRRQLEKLRKETVPPYDPSKFPNKWCKLDPAVPSRTLTAHLGKDTYSHIHYDSNQKRAISVREAARLQSFPDGFQFHGALNASLRQIGNAVPPLLALAVSQTLLETLLQAAKKIALQRDRQVA